MVYFVAKVVPFVAKGGPVLMAKGGILPVAEIGILYLTIHSCGAGSNNTGKSALIKLQLLGRSIVCRDNYSSFQGVGEYDDLHRVV